MNKRQRKKHQFIYSPFIIFLKDELKMGNITKKTYNRFRYKRKKEKWIGPQLPSIQLENNEIGVLSPINYKE